MPKRIRSEDEENYSRHLKTHVSERELGTGVLKDLNMRNIYEKTLALLFRGQKNVANNNAPALQVEAEHSKDKQKYRQLCFSNSGTRLDSQSRVDASMTGCCSCVNNSCKPTHYTCQQCSGRVGGLCLRICDSCRAASCGICEAVQQCYTCAGLVCNSCSSADTHNNGVYCSPCQM